MTDNTQEIDDILLMLTNAAYAKGNEAPKQVLSGVPRITTGDAKQAILDWHNKQTLELLDRLESNKETLYWWTGGEYDKTTAIDMRAIATERAKLKEVK